MEREEAEEKRRAAGAVDDETAAEAFERELMNQGAEDEGESRDATLRCAALYY